LQRLDEKVKGRFTIIHAVKIEFLAMIQFLFGCFGCLYPTMASSSRGIIAKQPVEGKLRVSLLNDIGLDLTES
jgi:hypothetical protein